MEKMHILAITAHPDDVELSCAGTLAKHAQMGHAVGILDLTKGELGTRGTPEIRLQEAADSAKVLGAKVRVNAGFRDGFFRNDEEHQVALARYIRYYQPDIVIANALADRHPDHGRAGKLIADACFLSGLSKIATEWDGQPQQAWRPKRVFHVVQDRLYTPSFIVDISEQFEVKMDAIKCFKSQFHNPGSAEPMTYISTNNFLKAIEHRDGTWGKMIGVAYGEGFYCENIPGITDLDKLYLPEIA